MTTAATDVSNSTAPSRVNQRIPGVPSPCGALRTASNPGSVGSGRGVFRTRGRPPLLAPALVLGFAGPGRHLGTASGSLSRRIRSRIAQKSLPE